MRLKIFILVIAPFFLLFNNSLPAQSIDDFVSVDPNSRDATFRLPETHTFQKIIQEGDAMTGGASYISNTDFTGYVPIKGSSINGYLSINNEADNGGVAMLDINYDQNAKLWNVSRSEYVDFSAFGRTSRNCSGAVTPWGTIITSEEVSTTFNDINNDNYLDYGWQVEIDPVTKQVIDKRWALGRFAHENLVVHKNWRTVYQGADNSTGFLYKFVADMPGDLSSGKLYVYKGSKTGGSGQWILIPNTTKNERNNTKSHALNVGATSFKGIEDVEIGPDGLVYFTVKSENKIYYFKDSDPVNGTSVSFLNKYAGNRDYTIKTVNGNVSHNWGYGNDNLAFDNEGNLWVLQDGQNSHIWVIRKGHTEANPKVEIFATSPKSSEPTGISFSPDGRFIFLSIQHPNGFVWQKDAAGTDMRFNSDATLVIARKEFLGTDCLGSCPDCDDNIQNYAENGTDCGGSCENCPTCFDRIKNGNETGIDCGGNSCVSCPTLNITKTDATCNGTDDGSAIAVVSGGAGTITYLWSIGDTISRLNNLTPGNYSVKIADSNGNKALRNFTIFESAQLNVNGTVNLPTANTANDGSVSISVSGGKSPFTYKWSNNATTKNIGSLSANTYTVAVTDANDCTIHKTFNASLPACSNFEVSIYKKNINCINGSDGVATALIAGGTKPFTYNWSNGNNTKSINNLSSGNYSVTVIDNNGCSVSNSVIVNGPSNPLNLSLSSINTNGIDSNTGGVIASVNGGLTPYEYSWSNGLSSSAISNISRGAYSLKVTDNRGCAVQQAAYVYDYVCPTINATISTTDITCYGLNDGAANITASGGATPYSINWSNGTNGVSTQNLCVGKHKATVTDAKGCSKDFDFDIAEPSPITIQSTTTNATDNLNNNGEISVNPVGGTGPYSYNWSIGDTIKSIVGTFSIATNTVNSLTDSIWFASDTIWSTTDTIWLAGDTIRSTGNIVSSINDTIFTENTTIKSIDGTIFSDRDSVWISGDTLWSATDTSWVVTDTVWSTTDTIKLINDTFSTIDCLLNGDYSVTVTDQNNCSASSNFKVQPNNCASFTVTLSKNDVNCFGTNTGSINTNIIGGAAPFSYAWSNGASSSNLNNVPAANYGVTITDSLGCQAYAAIEIIQPSKNLNINLMLNEVTAVGINNGNATAIVSGGTSPYTYNWSNGSNTIGVSNLAADNYALIVTDANNCSANKNFTINNVDCSAMIVSLTAENTGCASAANASIIATVRNAKAPISYNWSNNATTPFLNNLSSTGSYSLTATDAKGCTKSKSVNVANNSSLQTNDNVTDLNAYNANNGAISVNVNGGNSPYDYYWGTGASSNSISNLPVGTYDFLAVDEFGCSKIETNTIDNYNCDYEVKAIVEHVSCRNENDGKITLEVIGGSSPYNYNWSDISSSTRVRNNLTNNNYSVTVTDNRNCIVEVDATVDEPTSSFTINVSKTNETYFNAKNGTATAAAIGGTQPITYEWSTGLGNANVNNLSAGSYSVKATDVNGCVANKSFSITGVNCNNISLNVNKNDITCFEEANGNATAVATGGSAPYKISWLNGDIGTTSNLLAVNNYATHVVDAVGCEANATFAISQPTELVFTSNKSNVTYFNAANGTASVNVNGGVTPYSYSWSNGSTTRSVTDLAPGQYSVDITDANDCILTETFIIEDVDCNNIDIAGVTKKDVTCRNSKDGQISVQINGGNSPFSYVWSNGSTQAQISNLFAGNYTVNITDSKGCKDARTIVLNNPAYFSVNLSTSNIIQGGTNTGSATLTISGGVGPYSINWSNGATTATVNNFAPGTHSYTATDANGCNRNGNFTICTPPYNVEELSVVNNAAVIGWDGDPSDNIYNYRYRNVTNGGSWQSGTTTNTFILLNNLPNCKNFEFEVFGNCSTTNGTKIQFLTDGCITCSATKNLYHLNVKDVSAFINWDLIPGSTYTLYYKKVGTQKWFSYETSITYAILYGLSPCSKYEWYVDTNCGNGTVFHTNLKDSFTTTCLRENDTTSDRERIDNIELAVYPNPAKDHISLIVNTTNEFTSGKSSVSLYDLSGKLIKSDTEVEQLYNYQLNIADLATGMYVIEVKFADFVKEVKFVKE